jgi:hypothetical protein
MLFAVYEPLEVCPLSDQSMVDIDNTLHPWTVNIDTA